MLHSLLSRLDIGKRGIFARSETLYWPRGALERLVELGLLCEIEWAKSIRYDGCDEGCSVEPEVERNPRTGHLEAFFFCAQSGCGGRVPVDLDDLRQWQIGRDALAAMLATQLDLNGQPQPLENGRVTLLGTLSTDTGPLDVFLVFGNCLPDTPTILQSCERFRASRDPVVLVPRQMPRLDAWPIRCLSVLAIAEHVRWPDIDGEIDWSALAALIRPLKAAGVDVGWMTVTEAAEALLDDVSGIDLEQARARVSRAASDGKFRTNGQARAARRIERSSFDAWRMQQRERDLAEADAWADEDE